MHHLISFTPFRLANDHKIVMHHVLFRSVRYYFFYNLLLNKQPNIIQFSNKCHKTTREKDK